MSYKDRIATEIINTVGGRQLPNHVRPWFGLYDRPMADPIKYPDAFRVESTGWDEANNEFVYVLYDRFMSSQSMIVIKEGKTVPPLAAYGSQIRMFKRSGIVDDIGTEVATLRGCRAVQTPGRPDPYEYVYELRFEDGRSTVISESKMKLMIDVHKAIMAEQDLERAFKEKAERQRHMKEHEQQKEGIVREKIEDNDTKVN